MKLDTNSLSFTFGVVAAAAMMTTQGLVKLFPGVLFLSSEATANLASIGVFIGLLNANSVITKSNFVQKLLNQ
ncbi:MAG: hypothetical protein AAGJ51_10765 [Pseudomonadota bacterium]